LHVLAPTELEQAVLDQRLPAAIGAFHHHVAGLIYAPLFSEEQTLYCGSGHPFFRRADEAIRLGDIAGVDFVDRGYGGGVKARCPAADFRPTATANNMEAIATLILSGRYIGYLPTHCAAPWVERRQMRSLLPAQLAYESLFEVITRKGVEQTPALQAFVAELQAAHGAVAARPATADARRRRRPRKAAARALSRASAAS
jgi:DNA-binding transcriptional LysR family regulator